MGKKKILVVEDEQTTATLLDSALKKQGYDVVIAHNGKLALSLLEAMRPDIIISDVIMPEINGLEFFKQIRKNENTSHIPFVVLTAHQKIAKTFGELDVDAVLNKPVVINDLLEKIEILSTYGRTAATFVSGSKGRNIKKSFIPLAFAAAIILVFVLILTQYLRSQWENRKIEPPEIVNETE